ncbi:hypothetical protein IQ265_15340 [Nodosilinea sp. LEGE 06152]|uniref:hypothetical protein n=1 Tax=Nodosilinea sp. LEGE 06152 TaxID=2777966 RepID=UPI00188289F9|nr:hypothetical protein [Nodosilinea sp. LEGE 06152]MBE9158190.1 hypothetical protein [Nodosilinea sp. LEGE 06152]
MNTQLVNSIIEVVRALPMEEQTALLETLNRLYQTLGNGAAIAAVSAEQISGPALEATSANDHPDRIRHTVVLQIDDLRAKLFKEHGNFSDSTELICEDRAR